MKWNIGEGTVGWVTKMDWIQNKEIRHRMKVKTDTIH